MVLKPIRSRLMLINSFLYLLLVFGRSAQLQIAKNHAEITETGKIQKVY